MTEIKPKQMLHSSIFHPLLRRWQCRNTQITPDNLMYPIFILDEADKKDAVSSMPGIFRYGINHLREALEPLIKKGLKSVLLFGVPYYLDKDDTGTNADSSENPIIKAVPLLKKWFPDLVIACDVCLCPYTNHGHCGILNRDGTINNAASLKRLAEISVAYAKAGADIIAPSDMMDGRIQAIKQNLIKTGYSNRVAVLSYSAKFASGFYGPFRDAAKSCPQFGDRQNYQLPVGSSGLAMRALTRDVEEGADMLMVKPGMPYINIVEKAKETHPHHPIFVYQVSGEFAMIYHAAKAGAVNLETILKETLVCMRGAGADVIITYFTPQILDMLMKSKF